jgi:hypothetical protein
VAVEVRRSAMARDVLDAAVEPREGSRGRRGKCSRPGPTYDHQSERMWRFVPLWAFAVFVVYTPLRIACGRCGIRAEGIPWATGRTGRAWSASFERAAGARDPAAIEEWHSKFDSLHRLPGRSDPCSAYLFARWCQENFFKYMREHYHLDRLIEYGCEPIPDSTPVVNPQWRALDARVPRHNGKLTRKSASFAAISLPEDPTPAQFASWETRRSFGRPSRNAGQRSRTSKPIAKLPTSISRSGTCRPPDFPVRRLILIPPDQV